MMRDNAIIMFSSIPWEWSADYFRQTALQLSRHNGVYGFIWHNPLTIKEALAKRIPIKVFDKPVQRVCLYTAWLWLPMRRYPLIFWLNYQLNIWAFYLWVWFKVFNYKKLVWIFDPGLWEAASWFSRSGVEVIYDCLDYFGGRLQGRVRKQFELLEKDLLLRATLVVANSQVLVTHCRRFRKDVSLVPQGFTVEAFGQRTPIRQDTSNMVLGYVGGINSRLNYDLLLELASNNPQWEFILWGPMQFSDHDLLRQKFKVLTMLPNVKTGSSTRSEMGSLMARLTLGIIPYREDDFEKYSFPMKLFEYFYYGLPVVSTPIEELRHYSKWVSIGNTASQWKKLIADKLKKPYTLKEKMILNDLALSHSWEHKIKVISEEWDGRDSK
jgi:glycosyltransferase involved in cell wall biosynthesis